MFPRKRFFIGELASLFVRRWSFLRDSSGNPIIPPPPIVPATVFWDGEEATWMGLPVTWRPLSNVTWNNAPVTWMGNPVTFTA